MNPRLVIGAVVFTAAVAAWGQDGRVVFVEQGAPVLVNAEGAPWETRDGYLACKGQENFLRAGKAAGPGDFHIHARLALDPVAHTAATFFMEERSHFGFDGGDGKMFMQGPMFGNRTSYIEGSEGKIKAGRPFDFDVRKTGREYAFAVNGEVVHTIAKGPSMLGTIGFRPWRSELRLYDFWIDGAVSEVPPPPTQPRGYTIPTIDLGREKDRQIIVESIPGQYLGHPTTVLLADNKTILVTYPLGHGGPAAVLKKSTDGGLTWSERLPVPENWATATNCPCIHRLTGPDGVERLFVFEGRAEMRQSVSLDNGATWTPFEPNGLNCVVAPITIVPISGGRHLALYHQGPDNEDRSPLTIWQSVSSDGGLTWAPERMVGAFPGADLCEPAVVRSPDGRQLACLMRENRRIYNSFLMTSDDEGETWSTPVELPASLTGDRHMPRYAHDGRLVIAFRDKTHESPTQGDFVAWVGTYDDIVNLREGQYRVRLLESPKKSDLGYPGLELLPDGTFVATTYAVLNPGELNSVVSVRFSLADIDAKAALLPQQAPLFARGDDGYHTYRIPAIIVSQQGTVLAFCEGRKNSGADHGDIDLMLKRSTDNGQTFGPAQVVWDDGENTIGNPAPVVDRNTGRIWLLFCRNNDRVFKTWSDDDGVTWAEPVEITEDVKEAQWTWYATGPVHGIQLENGRLLIPCDHRIKDDKRQYSHAVYSDDGGETWKLGGTVAPDTDECTAVATVDGRVYLNMRSYAGQNRRAEAWSEDGGETWSEPLLNDSLIEPVCQGSVLRYSTEAGGGRNRVLFSNPASTERKNLTVRVSYDECGTWSGGKLLYGGPAAYSDMAVTADGTLLVLYECGPENSYQTITLARCQLNWLEE